MKKFKENILLFIEQPYYTKDELKTYYQIAIDESIRQKNTKMANYYKRLLISLEESNNNKANTK